MKQKKLDDLYERVKWARDVLGLSSFERRRDIQKKYRELSKRYHPDKCKESRELCEQKIREINEAYNIILQYIEEYYYGFDDESISRQDPNSDFKERFMHDWLWGDGK